jgi:hypothetical protein
MMLTDSLHWVCGPGSCARTAGAPAGSTSISYPEYVCSIRSGNLPSTPAFPSPSIATRRGSQKRPFQSAYSTVM